MTTQTLNRKPIFDALRKLLGRGFKSSEIAYLDDAIDDAMEGRLTPDAPSTPEQTFTPAQTSKAGIDLIHSFEGYAKKLPNGSVQAYPDPGSGGKPYTIGWGATTDENGNEIAPGTIWSRERADKRFVQHMGQFEREVIRALGDAVHATSQAQFDAMVSFAYNVGPANLRSSTLLRKHKAGDFAGAANEFKRWNRAAGRVMRGLIRRRAAEADLYRSGM